MERRKMRDELWVWSLGLSECFKRVLKKSFIYVQYDSVLHFLLNLHCLYNVSGIGFVFSFIFKQDRAMGQTWDKSWVEKETLFKVMQKKLLMKSQKSLEVQGVRVSKKGSHSLLPQKKKEKSSDCAEALKFL